MGLFRTLSLTAALGLMSQTALGDDWKDESGKARGRDDWKHHSGEEWKERNWHGEHGGNRHGNSYFHRQGYSVLNIPEGHYPPPGECRIWYPGRPPGQQPPPSSCGVAAPPGAWLIEHPPDAKGHVHVTAYDPYQPGTVLAIGEFAIGSGAFVRIIFSP